MLPLGAALKPLIQDHADPAALRAAAIRDGMLPLRIAGARKIAAGLTTPAEVLKVAPPPLRPA